MKPRLRKRYGIWGCVSGLSWFEFVMGFGYTPEEAYAEWKREVS